MQKFPFPTFTINKNHFNCIFDLLSNANKSCMHEDSLMKINEFSCKRTLESNLMRACTYEFDPKYLDKFACGFIRTIKVHSRSCMCTNSSESPGTNLGTSSTSLRIKRQKLSPFEWSDYLENSHVGRFVRTIDARRKLFACKWSEYLENSHAIFSYAQLRRDRRSMHSSQSEYLENSHARLL